MKNKFFASKEFDNYKVNYKLFLILTFFSGMPVLIYEIIWMRMLSYILGSYIFAVSIIIATFMLGLSLGSYLFGRYADKIKGYLRLYGFIEFGIGLSALIFPLVLAAIKTNKFWIFPFSHSHTLFIVQKMLISFFVLLIPTVLMGGTLPVISKFIKRDLKVAGKGLGYLYGFNIVGSIIGCLLAVFIMMEHLGLLRSVVTASAVNILIGFSCLVLDRRFMAISAERVIERRQTIFKPFNQRNLFRELSFEQKLILFAFGLSGFTALAYEVLWTRMLIFWLGNTVYSFGIILSVFLGCLALGSFVSARLIDKFSARQLRMIFASLEFFIGLAAFVSIYLYTTGIKYSVLVSSNIFAFNFVDIKSGLLTTFLTFFLIAFPFGIIFPLALRLLIFSKSTVCGYLGLSYGVNTLGTVFGSLITGLVLIPVLGVQNSIFLVAFINISIFCLIFVFDNEKKRKLNKTTVILGVIFIAVVMQIIIPRDYLKGVMSSKIDKKIIFFKEGRDSTVIVSKEDSGYPYLWINGLVTASPSPGMKLRAHIPLLFCSNPEDVLVIGFGSGLTLGTIAELYGIKTDCVEISSSVIEAGKFFSKWNYNVLNSRNANILLMDARNFVELTKKKYDVIIIDASHPYLSNSSSLFSKEFYAACLEILKDDGLMLQWIPLRMAPKNEFKMMVKTFSSVFENSYLLFEEDVSMLGLKKPLFIDTDFIDEKLSTNLMVKNDLLSLGINDSGDLLGFFITDNKGIKQFTKDVSIITDDRPCIEFSIPRYVAHKEYKPDSIFSLEEIAKMKSEFNWVK